MFCIFLFGIYGLALCVVMFKNRESDDSEISKIIKIFGGIYSLTGVVYLAAVFIILIDSFENNYRFVNEGPSLDESAELIQGFGKALLAFSQSVVIILMRI